MGSRNLSRLLVCHSSNTFNILSIVEISVIFLAWQLNVQVHGQVQVDRIYSRTWKDCTGQNETLHRWYFIQGECIRAVWLNTHILRLQSCRSGACETLTEVGEKRVFQTPGGALNMSSCQDRPQAVRGDCCRAPLLLCGCWDIFFSCLFVEMSKTQRKPDRNTTTIPSMRWE